MTRTVSATLESVVRMGRQPARFAWGLLVLASLPLATVRADGPEKGKSKVSVTAAPKAETKAGAARLDSATKMNAEREQAALEFAREHHAELADLLTNLKGSNRAAYEKGIHALFRDSERLARTRVNNPGRYEFDLEQWKIESRIRLTVARTMMDDSSGSLKEELRNLVARREDVKLRLLKFNRDRLTTQLSKTKAELAEAESNRDERIDREVDKLLKSAPKKRDVKAANAAPAAKEKPVPDRPAAEKSASEKSAPEKAVPAKSAPEKGAPTKDAAETPKSAKKD
ncbi:hypothetical protein VT03_05225 [Planctomyces sp. SH-PL14]|nr:hypothetical protein [Planctomyces sp. SH-PL14]AMV17271.1 hypothetical protein VT03_05225 [Planctomyces sp. SH-PL14]